MTRKLALKRLTASDLTLFKWHYQINQAGKQKALNLDAEILVNELYPQLGNTSPVPRPRYPLDLYLCGPGLAPANNLQRKILKQHKNWRLNGELIDNPVENPTLYNVLAPGDFALFEFSGNTTPAAANIVLIAAALPSDAVIHSEMVKYFPRGSMRVIDDGVIQQILTASVPPAGHPLYDWVESRLLEDAVLGGAEGVDAINSRRGVRGIRPDDFVRIRQIAEATGVFGEELLNAWLEGEQAAGRISNFEWTSSVNAIAPYDFCVTINAGEIRLTDAKSTVGDFSSPIHMSLNEIKVAVHGPELYDICRIYNVTEDGAEMRIARNIGPALIDVLLALSSLPAGFKVDSVSIRPDIFAFEPDAISLNFLVE